MPDLSDTKLKCRMGTAKNFTLLLLLYRTQAKEKAQKQICRYWRDIAILEDPVKLKHRHIIIRKESLCG